MRFRGDSVAFNNNSSSKLIWANFVVFLQFTIVFHPRLLLQSLSINPNLNTQFLLSFNSHFPFLYSSSEFFKSLKFTFPIFFSQVLQVVRL